MIKTGRLLAAFLLVQLLAACASQPLPEPDVDATPAPSPATEAERWEEQWRRNSALEDWEVRGKVGYALPDDAGSASLRWRQDGEDSKLRLAGPLGANSLTLRSDGALIRLKRDGIERSYPADAAPWLGDGRLLPIPVDAIQHWLRGIPDPGSSVTQLQTRAGLLRELTQDGWIIAFESYETDGDFTLPARLVVSAPDIELRLTVLLREWTLP